MAFGAFISYSRTNADEAQWLHKRLERYRLPKKLTGRVAPFEGKSRIGRVFIDRAELPISGSLSGTLRQEIGASDSLIVVCSPAAAASQWVNAEIEAFRELRPGKPIFCIIVDGDAPVVFPPALGDVEPLAADMRPDRDGRDTAFLKLVSGLFGLRLGDLRDREAQANRERARRNAALATVFGVLAVGAVSAAIAAFLQFQQANLQRDRAEQFATRATQTSLQTITDISVMNVEGLMNLEASSRLIESALEEINATLEINSADETLLQTLFNAQIVAVQAFYSQERFEDASTILEKAEALKDQLNTGADPLQDTLRSARLSALYGTLRLEEDKASAAVIMLTAAATALASVEHLLEPGDELYRVVYETYAEVMILNAEALETWGRDGLAREAAQNAVDILSNISSTDTAEIDRMNQLSRAERALARIPAEDTIEAHAAAGEEICQIANDAYRAVMSGSRDLNAFKQAIASQEDCANTVSNLSVKMADSELICLSFSMYERLTELVRLAQQDQVRIPRLHLQVLNNEIIGTYLAGTCDSAAGVDAYLNRLRAQVRFVENEVPDSPMKTKSVDGAILLISRIEQAIADGLMDRTPYIRPDGRAYDDPPPWEPISRP